MTHLRKTFFLGLSFGVGLGTANASVVEINLDEEHQAIRGFGGMVHNAWQGGKGLSAEDAKIAFGTGDGELGLSALRIPINENSSDWSRDLDAAKLAKSYGAIVYATPWKPPTDLHRLLVQPLGNDIQLNANRREQLASLCEPSQQLCRLHEKPRSSPIRYIHPERTGLV